MIVELKYGLPEVKFRSLTGAPVDETWRPEVVVPVEPTEAMLSAAYGIAGEGNGGDRIVREIWQAMIEARP